MMIFKFIPILAYDEDGTCYQLLSFFFFERKGQIFVIEAEQLGCVIFSFLFKKLNNFFFIETN